MIPIRHLAGKNILSMNIRVVVLSVVMQIRKDKFAWKTMAIPLIAGEQKLLEGL